MAKGALFFFLRVAFLGVVVAEACVAALAAAPTHLLPVPAITIYPGDTIQNRYLIDRHFDDNEQILRGNVIESRLALVGKLARRTLLPGKPIPVNAVTDPNAVSNGQKVRVVFSQDGLYIQTYCVALQTGRVGQVISVRNPDSGTTISGVVQADGSVRVGG